MTAQEKAEAKAKVITAGTLAFLILSCLIWIAGAIFVEDWFGCELPYWVSAAIAAPVIYFFCKWNFDRAKKLKPPSEIRAEDEQQR